MANLTVVVDDETLKRARIKAIERGESVNQVLAARLAEYADSDTLLERRAASAAALVELSRSLSGSSQGRGWEREDLYEGRIG